MTVGTQEFGLNWTVETFKDQLESFRTIGGFVGTLVSASFLLAIAFAMANGDYLAAPLVSQGLILPAYAPVAAVVRRRPVDGEKTPERPHKRAWRQAALLLVCASGVLTGCAPLAMTAMGVGASTGISHTANGINYRTFTVPAPRVRVATIAALKRMGIKVDSTEKIEGGGDLIKASSADRQIEVELESISANTTRMRAVAKKGSLFYDGATGAEVILQTEKLLKIV